MNTHNDKPIKCSICFKEIEPKGTWTLGNNAQPINDGRCCDACNNLFVIPVRLAPSTGPVAAVRIGLDLHETK